MNTTITPQAMTPEIFQQLWLPKKPLCSNDINAYSYRQSREKALTHKWIEVAPLAAQNLIVLDIDREWALPYIEELIKLGVLPEYNFLVLNLESTHAHVGWFIEGSVNLMAGRDKAWKNPAQYFFANVREMLRQAGGGDRGYTGRTMRNPTVNDHARGQITVFRRAEPWSMKELAALLPEMNAKRSELVDTPLFAEPAALTGGRNHDTFNALRVFAYSAYHRTDTEAEFIAAIHERANEINMAWSTHPKGPMTPAEVAQIVKSIGRWVLRTFTKTYKVEDLSRIQAARASRRWLATDEAKELHRQRIANATPEAAVALQARLDARLAWEAFDAEIAAYIAAGEKLRHIYAALGEPRGIAYKTFAKRCDRIRARAAAQQEEAMAA